MFPSIHGILQGGGETNTLANGLVVSYQFENAGNLGLDDSGNGNHLTVYGTPSQVSGVVGYGVRCNAPAYMERIGMLPFTYAGGYTFAQWIHIPRAEFVAAPSTHYSYGLYVIPRYNDPAEYIFRPIFGKYDNKPWWYLYWPYGLSYQNEYLPPINSDDPVRLFVSCTYDGSLYNAYAYWQGVEMVDITTWTGAKPRNYPITHSQPLDVTGAIKINHSLLVIENRGSADQLFVWNRGLTADEVALLATGAKYNSSTGKMEVNQI